MTPEQATTLLRNAGQILWVAGADLTIWLRMNQQLKEQPSRGRPGDFFEFATRTTFDSVGVRLRGLLKDDLNNPETISIASVVSAVAKGKIVPTWERLLEQFEGLHPRVAEACEERFSEYCGHPNAKVFPAGQAEEDLSRCKRAVDPIRVYVNDWVAHIKLDPEGHEPSPYHYLRAWCRARRMIGKYEFLLGGTDCQIDPLTWLSSGWEESFNQQWF